MEDNTLHKLSTSALAKELDISSQQLFGALKDFGWIRKVEDGWALTGKGEFEGGEYVHSKRYGRYVVWPPELTGHPLLQALEDQSTVSASTLGKAYQLGPREINRLLAELGWIKHSLQGWQLTAQGELQGGIQLENEHSGTFYVVWPEILQQNPVFKRQVQGAVISHQTAIGDDDLFAKQTYQSIDGHIHNSTHHLEVCQWLYAAGLAHACQRRLPVEAEHCADFYLPKHHIYIECWDETGDLADRMARKNLYQTLDAKVIDIQQDNWQNLDEFLTRQLRKCGVRIL
jgi:hypothetical protein